MENLIAVARQVAVLFALIGVGAAARWTGILKDAAAEGLVDLLVIVVTPCVIANSFVRPFEPSMAGGLAAAFAIAFAAHVAAIFLAKALVRKGAADTRCVLRMTVVFSNAGFMGIPLEQAIIGADGVFYGSAYIVAFNLFMWTWGLREMQGDRGGVGMRRILVNPGTVGLAAGLPVFLLSIPLPTVVSAPLGHMADLNTPLAMIVIGHSLARANLGKVLRCGAAHFAAFLRLVAFPLLVVAALVPLRGRVPRDMLLAVVVAASAPVAAMVSMFATRFRRDVDTAAALVSGTTLASVATMPPVIALAMKLL